MKVKINTGCAIKNFTRLTGCEIIGMRLMSKTEMIIYFAKVNLGGKILFWENHS